MKTAIGISEKNSQGSVKILNQLLSDEFILYTKTRNYHWNVSGPHFSELHKFFESQYEALDEIIDEVAERAKALGGRALGSLKEFLNQTSLTENVKEIPAEKMIGDLLSDHETLIRGLRESLKTTGDHFGDMGTSDFLTGLMEQHEKMAWMLRAFVS